MMSKFLKKSSLIVFVLATVFALKAENREEEVFDRAKSNRQRVQSVQVLVSPTAQNFSYTIDNGTGEILEPTTLVVEPLLIGGSSILSGLIFPADTIDPTQANFNVDQQGRPLTAQNSIGTFFQEANTLTDIFFVNTAGTPFPAPGTNVQLVEWFMMFNNNCCMTSTGQTNVAVEGVLQAGNFGSNQLLFFGENMPAIQAGPHASGFNMVTSARVFFSQVTQVNPNPQMLIEIDFDSSIRL